MLEKGDRILLAVSGGPDSVFLLYTFLELKKIYSLDLAVAHFNHGLRGKEADDDERFTNELSKKLDLTFFSKKENIKKFAKREKISLEEAGRRRRYKFLEETLKKWKGSKIATGHTLTDTVETLIFNLIRGAGPKGLSGIPPKRNSIIRPLLVLRREEIKEYLDSKGIRYRIDPTNLDTRIIRNFIRHKVLPLLREVAPGFEENVLRTSLLLRETVSYLEEVARSEITKIQKKSFPGEIVFKRSELLKLTPIIRKWMCHILFNLSFEHTESVEELIKKRGFLYLPEGWKVEVSYEDIRFYREEKLLKERELKLGLNVLEEINTVIEIKKTDKVEKDTPYTVYFPMDSIKFPLILRGRREGDRIFVKPGMTKKLKKIFIDRKIPKWKRDLIPLIEDEEGILWVIGIVKALRESVGDEEWIKMEARKYESERYWIYDS